MKQSSLDRKFDRIREKEEAGLLKPVSGSRAVRKLLSNPLAVAGIVIFTIIKSIIHT